MYKNFNVVESLWLHFNLNAKPPTGADPFFFFNKLCSPGSRNPVVLSRFFQLHLVQCDTTHCHSPRGRFLSYLPAVTSFPCAHCRSPTRPSATRQKGCRLGNHIYILWGRKKGHGRGNDVSLRSAETTVHHNRERLSLNMASN